MLCSQAMRQGWQRWLRFTMASIDRITIFFWIYAHLIHLLGSMAAPSSRNWKQMSGHKWPKIGHHQIPAHSLALSPARREKQI